MASLRRAINRKCKDCAHDPKSGQGTWRQQVEACPCVDCPLWEVRPKSLARPDDDSTEDAEAPEDAEAELEFLGV
ncbi:MAG: hypothetical protein RJQ08_13480 [Salinisphaeraceae bacterium]